MASYSRILVPTDYSTCSEIAFQLALRLGETLRARVDVVHVWSAPFFGPEYDPVTLGESHRSLFNLVRAQAESDMSRFVAAQRLPESIEVIRHVHSGEPAKVLLDVAKELGSDLIVVGTHGRTGAKLFLLGSVATRLLRLASCPVLTVPPPAH